MEDPDETGERTYTSKWNGGTYDPGTGRIGKHGGQDAENGASCNKAAVYIYIYISLDVAVGAFSMYDNEEKYLRRVWLEDQKKKGT